MNGPTQTRKSPRLAMLALLGLFANPVTLTACGEGGPYLPEEGKTIVNNNYHTRIVSADPDGDGFTADQEGDVVEIVCTGAEEGPDAESCRQLVRSALRGVGDCDGFVGDDPVVCGQLPAVGGCEDARFSACARCINPVAEEVCDGVDNNCVAGIDEGCPGPQPDCREDADCETMSDICNGPFVAERVGRCLEGVCDFTEVRNLEACEHGCEAGVCQPQCEGDGECLNAPAPSCEGNFRLTFVGACVDGSCSYPELAREACAFGCNAGACLPDPCANVVCNEPEVSRCEGATLVTQAPLGVCANGECTYAENRQQCAFGCNAGACNNDPCSGIQCSFEQRCIVQDGEGVCAPIPCNPVNDNPTEDQGDCVPFRPEALQAIYGFGCHPQMRVCVAYEDPDGDEWAGQPEALCADGIDGDLDGAADLADADCQDVDRDGIPNGRDNCLNTPNPDQIDADRDGRGDACDNCPLLANHQGDEDGDGIGDACDALNCVPSNGGVELCDQRDNNCDGRIDEAPLVCVQDADRDGVADEDDNCPLVANANQEDVDRDGVGDACDNIANPPPGPDVCMQFEVTITVASGLEWWPAAGRATRSFAADPNTYRSQAGECSVTINPRGPVAPGWCQCSTTFGRSACGELPLGGFGCEHNRPRD